jgi:OOP family OmpA-OmpF porin
MTRKIKMRPLAVGIMLATGTISVQAGDTGLYIAPNAGYYIFDQDNNNRVDDAVYYGIDLGFQFNKYFAIQLGYSWLDDPEINTNHIRDGYPHLLVDTDGLPGRMGETVDAQLYRLEGILNLDYGSPVIPYLALGYTKLEQDPIFPKNEVTNFPNNPPIFSNDEDKDEMVSAGGGIKYKAGNFRISGDVRALHSWDNEDTDYTAGMSVGYLFAAAEPAPVIEEEPEALPGDADGDGVYDEDDQCPGTPPGVEVDSVGCPIDSDRDGVPDYLDKCPGTPFGARVDSDGCPQQIEETITRRIDVKFDTDKSFVQPQFYPQIEAVAQIMREYIRTTVTIEGHTDSVGAADYNQKLSQRRADAVREVLISQFGVDPSRLIAIGYGETRPVADNGNAMGRQENRRVEAVVTATVETLQQTQ